jgi:hypothetical protein
MAQLDTVVDRQAQWSESANQLKSTIDRARRAAFFLSILGALAAALASQMLPPGTNEVLAGSPRTWVAVLGVVCLAAATFFSSRLLGAEHVTGGVRARAIAERLKREAFKFAAAAAPYDDADRDKAAVLLEAEREKIENDGDDLLPKLVAVAGKGSVPRGPITQDEYLARRVNGQIDWYKPKADGYRKAANSLRRIEFSLALAATLITAVASVAGKAPLFGLSFDFAALTAVLTTVAGAVLAHVEASRFDFLAMTYLATARRLEDRRNGPHAPWSDFVNDCENILAAENASWIAKWTK